MAINDLDNYEIQYMDFFAELPGTKHRDALEEKRDYIDGINTDITDLHDSADSGPTQGLSDQQVNALAQDQYNEAGVNHSDRISSQDVTLFSENI